MNARYRLLTVAALGLLVLAAGATSHAECTISGTITAEAVGHELGLYRYTLYLTWDTDSVYGLSHIDLLLDTGLGACVCEDFANALAWEPLAGWSIGVPDGCMVDYEAFLECDGDPSIPGIGGILLKFEPIEDESCEPGPIGSGTFLFYSDVAPEPIDADNLFLVNKHALFACEGQLTGEFPGLACDPVANSAADWTTIKRIFQR
jgi:hypothetical protein